jgi:hypothetical protein
MAPRTIAIGVTSLVIAAGLVAILVSGDSNDSEPAAPPSLAAVTQPDLSAIAPTDAGAVPAQGQSGPSQTKKGAGPQGNSLSTELPQGPSCPPNWTKELCRSVGEAAKRGEGKSHEVKDGQCPLPTKQMCEDAGRAVRQGQDASHEVGPNECALPTQEMCEEAGRQNQQAGVNPFK